MERNRWDKKRGWFISFFLLLLSVYIFTGISEASVTLKPRYNGTEIDAAREQYVYFGKFKHRLYDNTQETNPTPILWRVMELEDHSVTQKGAILLSHYLLESMPYQANIIFNGTNYVRDDGSNIVANVWDGSDVQEWLNNDFLNTNYFSGTEQGAMLDYPYNRYSEGESTASTHKIVLPSGKYDGSGPFFDKYEMGTWFESEETNANNNTRKADFKGGPVSFNPGGNDGWYYWTRSPAFLSDYAYFVIRVGKVNGIGVDDTLVAVRPALFLNLESIIFKSASDDFDLGLNSAAEGGSRQNPYLLVLPSVIPNGAPGGWTTEFISADKAPQSATVSGKTVTLQWSTAISPAVKNWPVSTDFVLSTGQSPISVSKDPNNKALQLTFAADVNPSGLKISYNLNTDAIVFAKTGNQASVVNSFANLTVTQESPVTPSVTPSHARFDGSSPADVKALLSGAALTAAKAGYLSITDSTPDGTRIPLGAGDYSVESRNLMILKSFLSKLGDGTHTLYFYNGDVQVGKITLTVTNSNGGEAKDSGSSGCNAGLGSAGLLAMGMMVLSLNKIRAGKKK